MKERQCSQSQYLQQYKNLGKEAQHCHKHAWRMSLRLHILILAIDNFKPVASLRESCYVYACVLHQDQKLKNVWVSNQLAYARKCTVLSYMHMYGRHMQ